MSQNASFLLEHNSIKFDLPHLRATSPSLDLLKLQAVDTLWLNPLAYPKRPTIPSPACIRSCTASISSTWRSFKSSTCS